MQKYLFTFLKKVTKYSLLAIIVIGLFVAGYKANDIIDSETKVQNEKLSRDLLNAVNNYRESKNLSKLQTDPLICTIATARAVETSKTWTHDGFETIWNNKFLKYTAIGENLATDADDANYILNAWINSPKHKEILDNKDYNFGCIFCMGMNSRCVMIAGKPLPQ